MLTINVTGSKDPFANLKPGDFLVAADDGNALFLVLDNGYAANVRLGYRTTVSTLFKSPSAYRRATNVTINVEV